MVWKIYFKYLFGENGRKMCVMKHGNSNGGFFGQTIWKFYFENCSRKIFGKLRK